MAKVKMGLRGLNAVQKLEMAAMIEKAILSRTQNGTFSEQFEFPEALIDDLTYRRLMLQKSMELAEFGDKRGIAARRLCEKELEMVIRQVGAYIEHVSKGDADLITATGFEVRSANNRSRLVEAPAEVKVKRLDEEGSVVLSWKPVSNSKNYLVQMCSREPIGESAWQTTGYSTRSRYIVGSLKPGTRYWFRILAIGALGIGPPSEVKSIMAA